MRRSALILIVVGVSALAGAWTASAQGHRIPVLSSCIKEFYDPGMYNYLTFQNTCTQAVTLVFVPKDGSGEGGTMDLRPGGKDSIGKTEGKKQELGSFEFFVCPAGQKPLDESGAVVSKPGVKFECRQKAAK